VYRKIVMAYDGSEPGQRALLDCKEIAQLTHPELFLIAVVPPPMEVASGEDSYRAAQYESVERQRFREILDEGLRRLAQFGYSARGEIGYGDAVIEIARFAGEVAADLIVVGHRHREGWSGRWWRRSVSKSLIERAPCSVLIVITR
jgi:nucleotide-binding universal stress UspA family protein